MDSLFGMEVTGAVRFIIAFVVVLALIAVTAWLVRRFGSGALASAGGRGRQPRLAVIDAASVDARRKLVLVRRDNVEHLLMIGGPSDVVIEPNIVRAAAATREVPPLRTNAIPDTVPRAAPLEEETLWPLQPEPAPRPSRPVQPAAPAPTAQWTPSPPLPLEAPARAQPPSDTLAELADALATQTPRSAPKRAPEPVVEPAEPTEPAPPPVAVASADTAPHLNKMADELEAALRRPSAAEPRFDFPVPERPERPAPKPVVGPPTAAESAPAPQLAAHVAAHAPEAASTIPEIKPAAAGAKPTESKKFYETLEQEMASLLGRPTGKT